MIYRSGKIANFRRLKKEAKNFAVSNDEHIIPFLLKEIEIL